MIKRPGQQPPPAAPFGPPMPVVDLSPPPRSGASMVLVMVVASVTLLMVSGVAAFLMARDRSAAAYGGDVARSEQPAAKPASQRDEPAADDDGRRAGPVVATAFTPPKGGDYFADPSSIVPAIAKSFGADAKLKQLLIHRAHVTFEIQNDERHVDRHTLRGGRVDEGSPVRLSGRDEKQLSTILLPLSKIDLAKLPQLMEQTRETLGWKDVEISHVIIEHGMPFANKPLIRVYARNDYESGRVEYDLSGKQHRVFR